MVFQSFNVVFVNEQYQFDTLRNGSCECDGAFGQRSAHCVCKLINDLLLLRHRHPSCLCSDVLQLTVMHRVAQLSVLVRLCDVIHTLFILGTDDIHAVRECGGACTAYGRVTP